MKSANNKSRTVFNCWRCLVIFYLLLFCLSAISIGLFATFLLIFRQESHTFSPKILLYFVIVPTLLAICSTAVGWISLRRKNVIFIKFFAVLLGVTIILEIAGSLWCFVSLEKTQSEVLMQVSELFLKISINSESNSYWNNIQRKYKCCGFHGPTDYKTKQVFPFSCCGSDKENHSQGSCTVIWQKGCSDALSEKLAKDLMMMSMVSVAVAVLQIPGVFFSWCFANRISRETI